MNIDVISIMIRYRESRGGNNSRRGIGSCGRIHGGERKNVKIQTCSNQDNEDRSKILTGQRSQ